MENIMQIIKEKEIQSAIVSLRDDGIMQFAFKAEHVINLNDLREMVATTGELGGQKKYPILVISGENTSIDATTKTFAATPEASLYSTCCAVIVISFAQRLLANGYLQFCKPAVPTQLFNDIEKAETWLKNQASI
jgi:hypothetical protein